MNWGLKLTEKAPDLDTIIESLIPEEKRTVKRQQGKVYLKHFTLDVPDDSDSDNEEINELSRLQDPGSQDQQVGGAINEGDAGKIKPTIDNSMVPSDQNQSSSDTLANISEFLKTKEGETTVPVDGDFTLWTTWSSCPHACGRTALRSRERYCTNPAPANGGRNCEGPRFQLKLCKLKQCAVDGGYSEWSDWTSCSQKCGQGMKRRRRYCNNPTPANGGQKCKGARKQVKPCYGKKCQGVFKVPARYICGYDPCSGAVCKADPTARCLVEHTCKAMFVNSYNQRMEGCKARHHVAKEEDEEEEQVNDDENNDDDDGSRISKLMSSKHGVGVSKDNNDEEEEEDEDGTNLAKLIGSKVKVRKKGSDDDEDDDDDGIRISKLMNSQLNVSDKDDNDDDKASHFAIGDKAYHKRPSFVEVEVQDGTRNLPVHFDKDSPLNMDIESAAEGKLGSGVLEMTEFVDQDKEEILVTRWSAWSSCTQSCGNRAKRKRVQYECSSRAKVIRDCAVSGDQEETCVLKPCPGSSNGYLSSKLSWLIHKEYERRGSNSDGGEGATQFCTGSLILDFKTVCQ
ncbi:hypothetical protein pdam_00005391 [Pocillopora damicornis]|uniref:Uncharacterized protein n=1 Tax=Pocillopora damicornis TaxID=46731 RepID=A0A3M6U2Q6_POCDA|nr:hypothetical protein pdam_00005391 [Pocillopora damicornis]